MNRLTKDQKTKVGQFRSITGATEKIAIDCLKVSTYTLESAIDYFYTSGISASVPSIDTKGVDALFAKYKEADEDMILVEGMTRFCDDLAVDPADIVMLVISQHMNAAAMCEFSKAEFAAGMLKMGTDSLEKLRKKLPELRAELRSEERFRDVYNYAYLFSREKGQKCVHFETAIGMWQLLFSGDRHWPLIDEWCEFLTEHHNRAISKDTWVQLFEFSRSIKPDFSNFDDNSAWPYLIDEFVEHQKEKAGSA